MDRLDEVAVLLAAAVVAVPLFKRLRLGGVLGYLAAGMVIGPWGLGLIDRVDDILHVAELGVVLLLFLIGLELEPQRLWAQRRAVVGFGGAQVCLTGAVLAVTAWLLGRPVPEAVVIGLTLALSSTAFVLQMLAERGELTTPHGRDAFAVLLAQDLAVIPILAIVPLLDSAEMHTASGPAWVALAKVVLLIAALPLASRYVLRPIFQQVMLTRSKEVYAAAALLLVIGTALIAEAVGLSMSLGAFAAGVLLAASQYRHELEAQIYPFKNLLLGIFFIAIGMSANLGLIATAPLSVLGLAVGLMAVKALLLAGLARARGATPHTAVRVGVWLAQGGEFAFVLFAAAQAVGLLAGGLEDLLVIIVTVSMLLTPPLLLVVDRIFQPPAAALPTAEQPPEEASPVLIAGFGSFGFVVGNVLRMLRLPFIALDSDPVRVERVRRIGGRVYLGDASQIELLRAVHADRARAIVLAIADVDASLRIAATLRDNFPHVAVYARAHNRIHAHQLTDLGVGTIARDTLLAGCALAEDLLHGLGVRREAALAAVRRYREFDQGQLAGQQPIYADEAEWLRQSQQALQELEALLEGQLTEPPGQGDE